VKVPLREGDAIKATAGGKPGRPGVILRIHVVDGLEWAFIAFGSTVAPKGAEQDRQSVVLGAGNIGFDELRLTEITWFKATFPGRLRTDDDCIHRVGTCPESLLVQLRIPLGAAQNHFRTAYFRTTCTPSPLKPSACLTRRA